MDINWDAIVPTSVTVNEVPDDAEVVPAEVLARFESTKGLGRTVKRVSGGTQKVKTIEGVTYLIPVSPEEQAINAARLKHRKRTRKS